MKKSGVLRFHTPDHSLSFGNCYTFPKDLESKAQIIKSYPIPSRSPVSLSDLSSIDCRNIVGHMALGDCVVVNADNAPRLIQFLLDISDLKFLQRRLSKTKVGLWLVPKNFHPNQKSK